MRRLTQLILLLLGTGLALWLIIGFWSLDTINHVVFSTIVTLICGVTGYIQWHNTSRNKAICAPVIPSSLPTKDFQGAVILVCGDSASVPCRETQQGWYLPVTAAENLPLLARYLSVERPDLIARVSVLLAIVPEKHQNSDVFMQSLRVWHRAIVQCKNWFSVIPPIWVNSWLSPPTTVSAQSVCWFTVMHNCQSIQIKEEDTGIVPLNEWSHALNVDKEQEQMSKVLWLKSLLSWFDSYVWPVIGQRQGDLPALIPYAWGGCFTPVIASTDNIWQTHIKKITTLKHASATNRENLPLPDILLPYLPHSHGVSGLMKFWQRAGLLCSVFLLLALVASFINNQHLIQRIGDDLSRYHRLVDNPSSTEKAQVQQQLRADVYLLDDWSRRGEPISLSLGLYQGFKLIVPLESALNSTSVVQPNMLNEQQNIETIRLDSLSLFDTGKFELKTSSTKVLINALVGIKAKPGWLIVIAGHTDDTGDDKSNQALSLKRAESVRNWIRDTGDVAESCFAVQGYGKTRPLKANSTEAGRAANRRVEISLVPQADACLQTVTNEHGDAMHGMGGNKVTASNILK